MYYGFENLCSSDDISHHGILGQKWGVRRYQNPDGTLTDAGKKHYRKKIEYVSPDIFYDASKKFRKRYNKDYNKLAKKYGLENFSGDGTEFYDEVIKRGGENDYHSFEKKWADKYRGDILETKGLKNTKAGKAFVKTMQDEARSMDIANCLVDGYKYKMTEYSGFAVSEFINPITVPKNNKKITLSYKVSCDVDKTYEESSKFYSQITGTMYGVKQNADKICNTAKKEAIDQFFSDKEGIKTYFEKRMNTTFNKKNMSKDFNVYSIEGTFDEHESDTKPVTVRVDCADLGTYEIEYDMDSKKVVNTSFNS